MLSTPELSAGFTHLLAMQVQQYCSHIELLAIRSAKKCVLLAFQDSTPVLTIPKFASRIKLNL